MFVLPQLVEKEMGYHGRTLSYKCSNEGIVAGFQTVGMSRRLEVHDPVENIHHNRYFVRTFKKTIKN